jgi:hypothetical protein
MALADASSFVRLDAICAQIHEIATLKSSLVEHRLPIGPEGVNKHT